MCTINLSWYMYTEKNKEQYKEKVFGSCVTILPVHSISYKAVTKLTHTQGELDPPLDGEMS